MAWTHMKMFKKGGGGVKPSNKQALSNKKYPCIYMIFTGGSR